MLSEKAKRELREAAASQILRADFDTMAANVRKADSKMTLDEFIAFLTAANKVFNLPEQHPAPESYTRALI